MPPVPPPRTEGRWSVYSWSSEDGIWTFHAGYRSRRRAVSRGHSLRRYSDLTTAIYVTPPWGSTGSAERLVRGS